MKRQIILTAMALVLFACGEEEEIPPSLRPDHEKQEQPNPPTPDPGPTPEPPSDALHNKTIPEDYRIPEVYITTENGKQIESKEDWVKATFRFDDPSGFYMETLSMTLTGKIRGRGNSTWGMPKKPYRIKLDEKTDLFGSPGDKDWVLLANYSDKTLLRNITAMELSRVCGMAWTPRMLSVDVYLNEEYIGVYTFCDHKEVAKDRVNIAVAGADELEGGYYLEIEEAMDEPVCFKTAGPWNTPVMFHEPEQPSAAQQKYVKDWFEGFEAALDHIQGDHDYTSWRAYIDIPSFIDYYIIQEITKNPDGNVRKSTYLTKEKGKKLEMYHVWDFDITLGNCDYGGFEQPAGWQMRYVKWYNQLFFDPAFKEDVVARWNELYPELQIVTDFIDRQYALMAGAEARNFERWKILGVKVWPNYYYYATYDAEYAFLKRFYSERLVWLNGKINSKDF